MSSYLTLAEVARRLCVCETTARKIVADWPSVVIGSRRRYATDALDAYLRTTAAK